MKRLALIAVAALTLTACNDEVVLHNLDEQTANRVILELESAGVSAHKVVSAQGKEMSFHVTVDTKRKGDALRVLEGLGNIGDPKCNTAPKPELFQTAAQAENEYRAAKERDVAHQLRMVTDVIDAKVSIAQPERDPLSIGPAENSPKATVTVKYIPGAEGSKPLSEPQVRAMVAGAVDGLTVENVVVAMLPKVTAIGPIGPDFPPPFPKQLVGSVVAVFLLMSLALLWSTTRLRATRAQLIRLQKEIAQRQRSKDVP